MTDILLIQPPIRDFYLTSKRTMPYGLACIAAALVEEGFQVEILDGLASSRSRGLSLPEEMSYLEQHYGRPDRSPFALFHQFKHFGYSFEHLGKSARATDAPLVGISSLFTAYSDEALRTAEAVKAYHPGCKVVVGGHHPTALPERVLACRFVDYIVRGEGEVSMPLLARALLKGEGELRSVPGLVCRETKAATAPPAVMDRLEDQPLPAMGLLSHSHYRGRAVVMTSRGCPLHCSYCSMGAGSPLPYRRRSVTSVLSEIERWVNTHDATFIDFEDENLSLDRTWFLSLLEQLPAVLDSDAVELRAMNGLLPHSLDEVVIRAMKSAGFRTLNLSVGSFSPAQLSRFNRTDERAAFDRALDIAARCQLKAVGYIIVGAPGQSAQDSLADLLFLAQRRVLAGVSVFYPSPASADYERCQAEDLLPDRLSLMRSSALPIDHRTSRLETVTLLRLGRVLNFIKSLVDRGLPLPEPRSLASEPLDTTDRTATGTRLLQAFLNDSMIRGVTPQGQVYQHPAARDLCQQFNDRLKTISIKGS